MATIQEAREALIDAIKRCADKAGTDTINPAGSQAMAEAARNLAETSAALERLGRVGG